MRSVLHCSIHLDIKLEANYPLSSSIHHHMSDWILDLSVKGTEMSIEM